MQQLKRLMPNHDVKREILAGVTTFLTMSYIIFINPAVLATAGMDKGAVFTATCLVTIFGTTLLALLANYPIAIAPGMSLNVYFAYVVVAKWGFNWQNALGMVFISGMIFVLLSITKLRAHIISSLPKNIHFAMSIGIGLLIALIALENNHLIVSDPNTLVSLGNLKSWPAGLFFLGFLIIVSLEFLQVRGAVLIGILCVTLISFICQQNVFQGILAKPPSISASFLQFKFDQLDKAHSIGVIFTFFLIAFFDATGTFIGVLSQPLFRTDPTYIKRLSNGLLADSCASIAGSMLGTSSTSPFIESAAGIQAGGRTGLTAITVSLLFVFSLFFYPLAQSVPSYAVGPVLLYIACCMLRNGAAIEFNDMTEAIPATLIIVMIPFTFSIADGIGIGIICYTVLHAMTGQFKKINPMLLMLTIMFALLFYFK